jgi:purine-binding chemotaxis protein CheW
MGRMSDARKRARQKQEGGSTPPAPPAAPTPQPPAAVPTPEPEPETAHWISRDEPLVFQDEPPVPGTGEKIALPSSGLASEILGRTEAVGSWTTMDPRPAPVEKEPELPPLPSTVENARSQNISFFGTHSREDRKVVAEATEHLVTFFLSNEEYALDVKLVQEIIRVTEVTPVPRAPGFIKGVINLRGRIIPVVDLKRKLDLGVVEESRVARIVVVKVRDRLIGLLVDGASQVLKVPVSSIEAAPEEVVEIDRNCIRGVAKLEKRLIILVDLTKILAVELQEPVTQ